LYTSVRRARERLEEFQDLPGATWLPVICQNPVKVPPTWQDMRQPKRKSQILPSWLRLQTVLLLSVIIAPFGLWVNINSIYKQVLGQDAEPAVIAKHINDLAKGMTLSQIRSETAKSNEAKEKIHSIYQQVLGRDATGYELNFHVALLEKEATLSSIHKGIAKTYSLLQNGNVISLECQGDKPGLEFLDGRDGRVALTASLDEQSTSTKWIIHVISNGVIALENQGHISGLTWLNGLTAEGTVDLAPNTKGVYTGTKWKIHILSGELIMLENQGHISGLKWLNGLTVSGGINLVSEPDAHTGTRWKIHY